MAAEPLSECIAARTSITCVPGVTNAGRRRSISSAKSRSSSASRSVIDGTWRVREDGGFILTERLEQRRERFTQAFGARGARLARERVDVAGERLRLLVHFEQEAYGFGIGAEHGSDAL